MTGIMKKAVLLFAAITITLTGSLNAKAYTTVSWSDQYKANVFINSDTNDSCVNKNSGDHAANAYVCEQIKTKTITTEYYGTKNEITLYTTYDVARFGNFRTNKKVLKHKVTEKVEDNYSESNSYVTGTDGKKYCKDIFGNKQEYSEATIAKAEKTNKFHAYGEYAIRFYTKKAGTYKFYYDALDQDGNVITTKTIKVVAMEDGDPIKEATFAGKRFYVSANTQYKGKETNLYSTKDRAYTTKSSGKLKFKMNKGFKIQKIEVGYTTVGYRDNSTDDSWAIQNKGTVWTEVKNGMKITLSSTDEGKPWYEKAKRHDAPGQSRIYSTERYEQRARTFIRITYLDKRNGTTGSSTFTIYRLINK
ncbi:hypothetical protein SAMN04487770_105114 [Butyrivibrio sp. ob235]|uniref:hypothetical protein n=1 Tax=Butyrivibrio sp. ob235 TaxID=1761780 RepID=UPI0008D63884|nr:hypothetical protein [Butyrivibrio sp. ob235]SEL05387.1 hypothetical protein SAMN04487770_105114 [Butyrivibrio sp. ob235]